MDLESWNGDIILLVLYRSVLGQKKKDCKLHGAEAEEQDP